MPRIHIKPAQVTAVDGNLARPGSNGRVGSRIRRVGLMIGAFAIAATTALGSATPAAAFTVLNASGYPGTSTVPVIAGQAYTRTDSSGAYGAVTFPVEDGLRVPRLCRIRPAGLRHIQSRDEWRRLQRVGANARVVSRALRSAVRCHPSSIVKRDCLRRHVRRPHRWIASPKYAGNVEVTWSVKTRLSNGSIGWARVGSKVYDYGAMSDYACATNWCQIGMTSWGGGAYILFS